MSDSTPVSVWLPQELRDRLQVQAGKRALELSTLIKFLVDERLRELESDEQFPRAEPWQRAQVEGSWKRYRAGGQESSWEEVDRLFESAGVGPPKTSPKTSRRKLRDA